jgi:hypothetical protein
MCVAQHGLNEVPEHMNLLAVEDAWEQVSVIYLFIDHRLY